MNKQVFIVRILQSTVLATLLGSSGIAHAHGVASASGSVQAKSCSEATGKARSAIRSNSPRERKTNHTWNVSSSNTGECAVVYKYYSYGHITRELYSMTWRGSYESISSPSMHGIKTTTHPQGHGH